MAIAIPQYTPELSIGYNLMLGGERKSRLRRDILDRRAGDRKKWTYIYKPITADLIDPYMITLERSKKFYTSWPILYFSGVPGKEDACFDHAGQILEDGEFVSEAVMGGIVQTPLEKLIDSNNRNKSRLTIVKLRDELFPTPEIRQKVYEFCQIYHDSIEGDSYDVPQLFKMMLMSMARKLDPFMAGKEWENIPWQEVMICSAIVDFGWKLLQEIIGQDIFPTTLSKTVPSPMDIFWSWAIEFVCGWQKVYID